MATVVLALLLAVADVMTTPVAALSSAAVPAVALVVAGGVEAEVALWMRRRWSQAGPRSAAVDLSSVWVFAAVLLMPLTAVGAVVVSLRLYSGLRLRPPDVRPRSGLTIGAATAVASHAAAGALVYLPRMALDLPGASSGLIAVAGALLAYLVVNSGLALAAGAVPDGPRSVAAANRRDDLPVNVAALSMGAAVAVALHSAGPAFLPLVLAPVLVLHRVALVWDLEHAVDTDGKTELLTAAAWQREATERLRRLYRDGEPDGSTAVLMIDIDRFKGINDTYGHPAGDVVLQAISAVLRESVREQDLVARYGGEEFAVLLRRSGDPGGLGADVHRVAQRIRRMVSDLAVEVPTADGAVRIPRVTVSVGGAIAPVDGTQLPQLVAVADAALYAAKDAGRDAVRIGRPPEPVGPARGGPEATQPLDVRSAVRPG